MNLDDGGVQRHGLDADAHHLRLLQLLEHPIEHAQLGPAVHARVDGVPVAEALGQAAPLAAVLGNVQDGIEHVEAAHAHVASLRRQAMLDASELFCGDLHHRTVACYAA
jgi:hypothetical protein